MRKIDERRGLKRLVGAAMVKTGAGSISTLAAILGIPQSSLYRIASGKTRPRIDRLLALSKAAGEPIEKFFNERS